MTNSLIFFARMSHFSDNLVGFEVIHVNSEVEKCPQHLLPSYETKKIFKFRNLDFYCTSASPTQNYY